MTRARNIPLDPFSLLMQEQIFNHLMKRAYFLHRLFYISFSFFSVFFCIINRYLRIRDYPTIFLLRMVILFVKFIAFFSFLLLLFVFTRSENKYKKDYSIIWWPGQRSRAVDPLARSGFKNLKKLVAISK